MTHFYETDFQIGSKIVLVFAEYTFSAGSPAHYGSLSYEGHPADPAESHDPIRQSDVRFRHLWRGNGRCLPVAR